MSAYDSDAGAAYSRRDLLAAASLASATVARGSVPVPNGKLEVWDLHCHLGGFEGKSPAERMREMIRFADRMGIDRLCVFMGYPFLNDPTPEQLRAQNDQVIQALEKWRHRAFGFVYLNPNYLEFSLNEL